MWTEDALGMPSGAKFKAVSRRELYFHGVDRKSPRQITIRDSNRIQNNFVIINIVFGEGPEIPYSKQCNDKIWSV